MLLWKLTWSNLTHLSKHNGGAEVSSEPSGLFYRCISCRQTTGTNKRRKQKKIPLKARSNNNNNDRKSESSKRKMCSIKRQIMVQEWFKEHTKFKELILTFKFPRSPSNLWDVLDKHVRSIEAPAAECTGLKRMLLTDTTVQLRGGLLASTPG